MILVTGATGLVGSHLVEMLLQQGQAVRALYNHTAPPAHLQKATWMQGDILDILSLEAAMEGVSKVYHCAALVSFNPKEKEKLFEINVTGTANVVNACIVQQVQKLLFVSSVAALGRIREDKPIDETMHWTPQTSNSQYGKSKYLAELEVWRSIGEGLDAVIVNPVIIIGAANWHNGSAGIFKSVYNQFPWYTNGSSGFVWVTDLVQAMQQLMDSPITAQRYIVSANNYSYKQIFDWIAEGFGKQKPHKLVTTLIAAIVWRLEAFKAIFTGKKPLLTKETAATAQAKVSFNNQKLLQALPNFSYSPMQQAINDTCKAFITMYQLS